MLTQSCANSQNPRVVGGTHREEGEGLAQEGLSAFGLGSSILGAESASVGSDHPLIRAGIAPAPLLPSSSVPGRV